MSRTDHGSLGSRLLFALTLTLAAACGSVDESGESVDDQTAWQAPVEGSCEAKAMLSVANAATLDQLDVDAKLSRSAAENILAARPLATLRALDDVASVGPAALNSILDYAKAQGGGCGGASSELGIVSDLDKTVIPESTPDLALTPYPGLSALYQLLEHRNGGADGDVHYVTARNPEKVVGVPAYLAANGVPAGSIDTGVGGAPWIAEAEKVRDISAILERTGSQQFVLFGDTDHVDPEAYKKVLAKYPDRIIGVFIHKVNPTVPPERVEGLHLHEGYAEVAALLYQLKAITRDEALGVMKAARDQGFAITDDTMQALLTAHQP